MGRIGLAAAGAAAVGYPAPHPEMQAGHRSVRRRATVQCSLSFVREGRNNKPDNPSLTDCGPRHHA